MRLPAAFALSILIAASSAQAQHAQSMAFAPAPVPSVGRVPHHGLSPVLLLGSPWAAGYSPVIVTQPAAPQVIVVQAQPATPPPKEEVKPINPLLIELRGGQYVRLEGNAPAQARSVTVPTSPQRTATSALPAVILVFRDGHREEAREYVIADGVMYVHGDYWKDGYWNKRVPLSGLDVTATLAANQKAETGFVLPGGPNVVVTRP